MNNKKSFVPVGSILLAILLGLFSSLSAMAQATNCSLPSLTYQMTNPVCLLVVDGFPDSFMKATLSNVPDGYDITNGTYPGWCVDYNGLIDPYTIYKPLLYYSYSELPPEIQHPNWDRINYILNHKLGNAIDIQGAIWHFMGGPVPQNDPIYYPPSPLALAMIADTEVNGAGFVPGPGEISAVICELGPNLQRNIFEVICNLPTTPQCRFNDFVYNDLNGNGTNDLGEPGITNVFVSLADCAGNILGSTYTDTNGAYFFDITNALPGMFKLIFTAPPQYAFPAAGPGPLTNSGATACFTIDANCTFTKPPGNDFFNPASVGDFVWEDLNHDGVQQANEPGVPAVLVTLYSNNVAIATTNTDGNGHYFFGQLKPASGYSIGFTLPSGYYFTLQDQGLDLADSDADASGRTIAFALASGQHDPTRDAGIFRLASIGDFVWSDLNRNGLQDGGEPGVPNVPVQLINCADNSIVSNGSTDGNGAYQFFNLLPGTYKVRISAPSGYVFTTPDAGNDSLDSDAAPATSLTPCTTLTSGQTNLTLDAGLIKLGAIGDFVWHDLNNNGLQDVTEPGIPNVLVRLLDCAGALVAMTNTDASGHYLFSNLLPGSYKVQFAPPAGFLFTAKDAGNDAADSDAYTATGLTDCITLGTGEVNLTVDAGLIQRGAIGDFVWEDLNRNGVQDFGEPGVTNVTVQLLDCSGVVLTSKTTDANGKYLFPNLVPGSYKIKFLAPSGYFFTTPYVGSIAADSDATPATGLSGCITLGSGEINTTIDAGLYRLGAIGDFVWYDINRNGIQDAGEPGVAGVIVQLMNCAGTVLTNTTTATNGAYRFSNLTPGSYMLKFIPPAGVMGTSRDVGTNDAIDSDADPITGLTTCITLKSGEINLTVDAGGFRAGSIGDFVWNDANCNGLQDTGEVGVGGVVVKLMDCSGNVLSTTTTTSAGKYLFPNLLPGSYKVMFVAPTNYTFTSQDVGSNDAIDSDVNQTNQMTACFTLADGQNNLTIDAGLKSKLKYTTYTQGGWGAPPNGNNVASLLANNFSAVYGSSGVVIGGTYTIKLTSAYAVQVFLPCGATPGALKKSYINPTAATEAGVFAGQTFALKLNVDFSNKGKITLGLANLKVAPGNKLAGQTVTQILALANKVIGGTTSALPAGCSISDLSGIVDRINNNFDNGTQDLGFLVQ